MTAVWGADSSPTRSGEIVCSVTPPGVTSSSRVSPDTLISSMPSALETTAARVAPSSTRAPAITSR